MYTAIAAGLGLFTQLLLNRMQRQSADAAERQRLMDLMRVQYDKVAKAHLDLQSGDPK